MKTNVTCNCFWGKSQHLTEKETKESPYWVQIDNALFHDVHIKQVMYIQLYFSMYNNEEQSLNTNCWISFDSYQFQKVSINCE
jgi:cytochrome c oxidase assembly protein Cox11